MKSFLTLIFLILLTCATVLTQAKNERWFRIEVTGNVAAPQIIEVRRQITLLEALAAAGGPLDKKGMIVMKTKEEVGKQDSFDIVIKRIDGKTKEALELKFSLTVIQTGGENPKLEDGDIIVVKDLPFFIDEKTLDEIKKRNEKMRMKSDPRERPRPFRYLPAQV